MNAALISHKIIYEKLRVLIPDLIDHIEKGEKHCISEVSGFMDLHFNCVRSEAHGRHIIQLGHYGKIDATDIPVIVMQIRITPSRGEAEALSLYEELSYREVYEKGYANERVKRELNATLDHWLTELLVQGHRIDLSTGRDLDEEQKRNKALSKTRRRGGNAPDKKIDR